MTSTAASVSHDEITLAVRYTPAAEPMLKYLHASVHALETEGTTRIKLDAQPQDVPIGDDARALVWLGSDAPASVRSWIEAGGTAIVDHQPREDGVPVWRNDEGDVVARAQTLGRGRLVTLAGAFAPQTLPALLDADSPQRLLDLVRGAPPAPTRAPADAMRPTLASTAIASSLPSAATKPLDPWLALLIATLVLIERIVATRPRAAP